MNFIPALPHGYVALTRIYSSKEWSATMYHYSGKVGPVLNVWHRSDNEVFLSGKIAIEVGASFLEWGENQPELTELFNELNEELNYD